MALDREAARALGKFASDADFIIRARVDLLLALNELDAKDKEIERLREALAAVEEELAQADAHNAATLDELALYERLIQIGEVAALDVTALKERLADLERRTGERSGGV